MILYLAFALGAWMFVPEHAAKRVEHAVARGAKGGAKAAGRAWRGKPAVQGGKKPSTAKPSGKASSHPSRTGSRPRPKAPAHRGKGRGRQPVARRVGVAVGRTVGHTVRGAVDGAREGWTAPAEEIPPSVRNRAARTVKRVVTPTPKPKPGPVTTPRTNPVADEGQDIPAEDTKPGSGQDTPRKGGQDMPTGQDSLEDRLGPECRCCGGHHGRQMFSREHCDGCPGHRNGGWKGTLERKRQETGVDPVTGHPVWREPDKATGQVGWWHDGQQWIWTDQNGRDRKVTDPEELEWLEKCRPQKQDTPIPGAGSNETSGQDTPAGQDTTTSEGQTVAIDIPDGVDNYAQLVELQQKITEEVGPDSDLTESMKKIAELAHTIQGNRFGSESQEALQAQSEAADAVVHAMQALQEAAAAALEQVQANKGD